MVRYSLVRRAIELRYHWFQLAKGCLIISNLCLPYRCYDQMLGDDDDVVYDKWFCDVTNSVWIILYSGRHYYYGTMII